jgi:glyoxylase-like metal-dependent hydrolase (beta-lactamase superfamily II)
MKLDKSEIKAFHSSNGARIYRIPLDLFPGLKGFAHLLFAENIIALIDVGSGFGESNEQLEAGLEEIQDTYGESAGWDSITHILISHAHIDHFGGLPFVHERCHAPVGIHELDRPVLNHYEDRLRLVAQQLRMFLIQAGVSIERQNRLMDLYLFNKYLYKPIPLDFTFNEMGMQVGPISILHVPGHCPGQVVFIVDEILLSSDHVLQSTSPHQAPEQLILNTGLGHYLESLEKIKTLSHSVHWVLGGHEAPFNDLEARIENIKQLHQERLWIVLDYLEESKTIAEVSDMLFPEASGYHELLAIEETGAHIEYLLERGYIFIENIDQIEEESYFPFYYLRQKDTKQPRIHSNGTVLQHIRRDKEFNKRKIRDM